MSSVTALNGANSDGMISVNDAGLMGMITLRGDLASPEIAKAVKAATGTKIPAMRQIETGAKGSAAWMSSDELLLMVDYADVDAVVAKISKSLSSVHHLAANVSDARAVFNLSGDAIRDVLAKGSPADMSVDCLPVGEVRRSRIGQLAVAFWFNDATNARLVCFRSVGVHIMDWLENASETGSEVGFH
jgi:sarcosine oxidase subunit gamma